MLTEIEKKVIRGLQRDLPVSPKPFQKISQELGLEEEALVKYYSKLDKSRLYSTLWCHDQTQDIGISSQCHGGLGRSGGRGGKGRGPDGRSSGSDALLRASDLRRLAI